MGLPSMVGRKKISLFNYIKLRVLNQISNWQRKLFSSGGKEVLIKAITQVTLAYAMSVFRIPIGVCADIQKEIARFWWETKKTHKDIHWLRWEGMCKSKEKGWMGFRELSSFNQALLAKQGWRIIQFPKSLMTRRSRLNI